MAGSGDVGGTGVVDDEGGAVPGGVGAEEDGAWDAGAGVDPGTSVGAVMAEDGGA